MNYHFQVNNIKQEDIAHLFQLTDQEREARGIIKVVADESPGYPCRVSLKDAAIGEELWAFNYLHHNVNSPYKASGPIFVRQNAMESNIAQNEVPIMLNHRLLSLRVYNKKAMMIDARTLEGKYLKETIQDVFANINAEYIQVHNSSPGCYNCQINRVN